VSRPAVVVDDVAKRFVLEHERSTSIKEAVLRGLRRATTEEFWALDGISFDVPTGSTFGLVGQNGSGKSTLLKCMARILRPDRGRITIDGRMSALLELGAGFHPELSGRENVYLNASILGLPASEVRRRFDDIVGFAGLERFIDTPVKNYSSGMYVRLGFSVAINVDPEVLLVDEVLAVGDEQFQQRCLGKFAELRSEGRTVVVVSHAMAMVRSLCDEAVWLDAGKLQSQGSAEDVVDAYLDAVRLAGDEEGPEVDSSAPLGRIEVRDDAGKPVRELEAGAPATVAVPFDGRRLDHPAPVSLVLEFRRGDGILVSRAVIDVDSGTCGTASYAVDALRLVPADYWIAASLLDTGSGRLVAAGTSVAQLRITSADGAQRFGVVDLGGKADWQPDT
jgi:ABC-type polysaccharide/polyol phosphate transport system ATPase subunit